MRQVKFSAPQFLNPAAIHSVQYKHDYFAVCGLQHVSRIRVTSYLAAPRERHFEFCRKCRCTVPMTARYLRAPEPVKMVHEAPP